MDHSYEQSDDRLISHILAGHNLVFMDCFIVGDRFGLRFVTRGEYGRSLETHIEKS